MLLDALDRKILAQLQRNSRASLQEIGQAVGLSASPCWGRIKKLEEAGVIQGYSGFCRSKGLRLKSACVARLFKRPVSRTGWQRTRLCLVGSTALF